MEIDVDTVQEILFALSDAFPEGNAEENHTILLNFETGSVGIDLINRVVNGEKFTTINNLIELLREKKDELETLEVFLPSLTAKFPNNSWSYDFGAIQSSDLKISIYRLDGTFLVDDEELERGVRLLRFEGTDLFELIRRLLENRESYYASKLEATKSRITLLG
jgi:hypothetical protein